MCLLQVHYYNMSSPTGAKFWGYRVICCNKDKSFLQCSYIKMIPSESWYNCLSIDINCIIISLLYGKKQKSIFKKKIVKLWHRVLEFTGRTWLCSSISLVLSFLIDQKSFKSVHRWLLKVYNCCPQETTLAKFEFQDDWCRNIHLKREGVFKNGV